MIRLITTTELNYIIAHFRPNRQFNYISNYLFLSISLYKYTIFSVCDNSYYKPIFARSFGSFPFWKWHSCELCDCLCEHMLPFSRVHTYQPWCTAITIEVFFMRTSCSSLLARTHPLPSTLFTQACGSSFNSVSNGI